MDWGHLAEGALTAWTGQNHGLEALTAWNGKNHGLGALDGWATASKPRTGGTYHMDRTKPWTGALPRGPDKTMDWGTYRVDRTKPLFGGTYRVDRTKPWTGALTAWTSKTMDWALTAWTGQNHGLGALTA
ncbi:hypothetical protein JTE90_019153 [Oedothorax gibbosus]|uniref:Uncharacterized protein n=1 Tax=Oedothorax gibbosus TaxID=931172 RepID=A0AAV6US25_9ARAC|nr:hypothetical protein JTE90_019153 [Oedothorax gibbosus]